MARRWRWVEANWRKGLTPKGVSYRVEFFEWKQDAGIEEGSLAALGMTVFCGTGESAVSYR
jgi:hypothetical protein